MFYSIVVELLHKKAENIVVVIVKQLVKVINIENKYKSHFC